MDTKLTLRIKKEVVEQAKRFAKKNNTSLSKMVEGFLKSINEDKNKKYNVPQNVRSLVGIVKEGRSDEELRKEYHEYRIKKHTS